MRLRVAMKVFLRGTGNINHARAIVHKHWRRECRRILKDMKARLPELLVKHRARAGVVVFPNGRGRVVAWTEVVLFAEPKCKLCWGFGLNDRAYCECTLVPFLTAYHHRVYTEPRGTRVVWLPGRAPEQVATLSDDQLRVPKYFGFSDEWTLGDLRNAARAFSAGVQGIPMIPILALALDRSR